MTGSDAALPRGFSAAGIASGIKANGRLDLALVATTSRRPANGAAVFTTNRAAAAPVQVSRRHLASTGGRVGAVVLNSGCANAATGADGLQAAELMATAAAAQLGLRAEEVLVCSTGVIGSELPIGPIVAGIPALCAELERSERALVRAAQAIMTTDTREKLASASLPSSTHLTALGKGAAMLAPNMATMLAVLMTDADVAPEDLHAALAEAADKTFNRLSIDGCTSTNDTVIALSSGSGGVEIARAELTDGFLQVCGSLARQMAADAEGGTKVVEVVVSGACDDESALRGARRVADANLVKCSWYGGDPNWGRIVSELGSAGIDFDAELVEVAYGPHTVCRKGIACAHDEDALARYLARDEIDVHCDLGLGNGSATILSADLTHGYIDENMGLS